MYVCAGQGSINKEQQITVKKGVPWAWCVSSASECETDQRAELPGELEGAIMEDLINNENPPGVRS